MVKGDDKTKDHRVVAVTPQMVFLSQICGEHFDLTKRKRYDFRFIADSEIVREGAYGFSLHEVQSMRSAAGLRPEESLYMITSTNFEEASDTTAEFARLHDGMLEDGLEALVPRNKRVHNRIWKKFKGRGFDVVAAVNTLFALDSTDCVHPLIPYSIPGALLRHGELEAFGVFDHMSMKPLAVVHI